MIPYLSQVILTHLKNSYALTPINYLRLYDETDRYTLKLVQTRETAMQKVVMVTALAAVLSLSLFVRVFAETVTIGSAFAE